MRVNFNYTPGQDVSIKSNNRNGVVQALHIDAARKQSAQVQYIDREGRQVTEWFPESQLVAVGG